MADDQVSDDQIQDAEVSEVLNQLQSLLTHEHFPTIRPRLEASSLRRTGHLRVGNVEIKPEAVLALATEPKVAAYTILRT